MQCKVVTTDLPKDVNSLRLGRAPIMLQTLLSLLLDRWGLKIK